VPLAIELAAARVRLLPPQALLSRLDQRFSLLTGGARDLPERQRTLRNTLDWSFGLLSAGEQVLFVRLGVLSGTFGLPAVEAVCGQAAAGAGPLVDTLGSLVDSSLVRNTHSSKRQGTVKAGRPRPDHCDPLRGTPISVERLTARRVSDRVPAHLWRRRDGRRFVW
jgi:predicted ATPase